MIVTNSAWDAKNADLRKKPIYVFIIGGQATVYSTHDLVREGITGTLPDYRPWLKVPTGATQSIDVQSGTSSIGEMQLEVVDVGGAVRTVVGTHTLEGQTATLLVGYPGLAYSQFITLNVYPLYKIVPSRGYGGFLFNAKDRQIDSKRTIWTHPINGFPLAPQNPWIIQGTPCEIIQAIYLLALQLDPSTVDLATMASLDSIGESLYCNTRPFLFYQTAPFTAKDFLEQQIYQPAGMYPVVTNLGQLSVRSFRPPVAGPSIAMELTQDNITVLPEFDRMPILNDLLWEMDVDNTSGSGSFTTTLLFLDATSLSLFDRSNERQIQSNGLRSELGGQWLAQCVSNRIFYRFAGTSALRGAAPVLTVEAFFQTIPVWVGDYVSVSHPLMPNLFTGALGVTDRVYEVIDRSPNYASGKMQFKLLDTGLTGAPAAPVIGTAVVGAANVY